MPVFLLCTILFLILFRVKMKQSNSSIANENADFWSREENANFSRKRDISSLDYIKVTEDMLPFHEPYDNTEKDYITDIKDRMNRKMLNLSGFTNTELKEQYGLVNLEELSNCDQNFLLFIRALALWGTYLYEHNDYERARQIMEYSLSIGSDISSVFTVLAHIYMSEKNESKVDELISRVEASDIQLKDSIIKKLKIIKLED